MHITKILVNSGQSKIMPKESRNIVLLETVGKWIENSLSTNRQARLPAQWVGYSATAADFQGGLVLSVYLEDSQSLVQTIAIARHTAHGRPLWRVISALSSSRARSVDEIPPCKTWCGVLEHGNVSREDELEDFALACAWFWRTHGSKFGRRARINRPVGELIFKPGAITAKNMPVNHQAGDSALVGRNNESGTLLGETGLAGTLNPKGSKMPFGLARSHAADAQPDTEVATVAAEENPRPTPCT